MFEFTRGGIKYTVKYGDADNNNFLVLSFFDETQSRERWPVLRDTDDIPMLFGGDEMKFLEDFINAVNKVLDEIFGEPEVPDDNSTIKERLSYAVKTKLAFNETTQHLEIK